MFPEAVRYTMFNMSLFDQRLVIRSVSQFYSCPILISFLWITGLVSFCIKCNHGGHAVHMHDWFANNNTKCPSGCGCSCILTHKSGEEAGYFTSLQKNTVSN